VDSAHHLVKRRSYVYSKTIILLIEAQTLASRLCHYSLLRKTCSNLQRIFSDINWLVVIENYNSKYYYHVPKCKNERSLICPEW